MSLSKRSRVLQSSQFAEKRRKKKIGMIVIFVIAVTLVLACTVLFLRIPFIQISKMDIKGIPTEFFPAVIQSIEGELKGTYFGLIPRSNIFLYPKKDIEKVLIAQFKSIQSLSISRENLSTIAVTISERTKAALVCEGFHDDSENTNCFYTDENGYVFAKAGATTTDNFIRYYLITDKGDEILGTDFIDSTHFKEIANFVAGSAKAGIIPLGVLISEGNQYEMYVKNAEHNNLQGTSTPSEITVYFDTRTPLTTTLSNFVAFWNSTFNVAPQKKATTTPKIDYINLRYGNTIFYSAQ